MKKILLPILVFILALASFSAASALEPDHVISNSALWQDVYSTSLYASFKGAGSNFLTSTRHASLLLNQIERTKENIQVIGSKKSPYIVGYKPILEAEGFTVEEFYYDNVNLELAKLLPDVTNFIIIDDSYGYNAIAVAPYAVIKKAYVIFANENNINSVYVLLNSRRIDSILIYGQVDGLVKDRLAQFNPRTINTGDRFDNNVEVVKLFMDEVSRTKGPQKQVILTNGEFIEQEIMSGVEPVLFIGRDNVPDQIREYVTSSNIEVGVLIGNELIGTATFVRRQLGISVFVKFAQGARNPQGSIAQVEDLDRFYLPRYNLNLAVYDISYNQLTNQLEVTYQNLVELGTYLKGTISLRYGDGETQIVGDETAVFIDKSEFKTIVYQLDPIAAQEITADLYALFGESPKSLEYELRQTLTVKSVTIQDDAQIKIVSVLYDSRKGQFLVKIENIGNVDSYVRVELNDLLVNDELVSVASGVVLIKAGETMQVPIDIKLSDKDIENNPRIRVSAYYGERERSLIKVIRGDFEFQRAGFGYVTGQAIKDIGKKSIIYLPLLIILILIILIFRMKKKCKQCGHKNSVRARNCEKCGAEFD